MDLLFQRYANPFLLLDQMILANKLHEFINKLEEKINHEKNWEFYLHKIYDKSFADFENSLVNTSNKSISKENIETTITDSIDILSNFAPEDMEEVK